MADLKAKIQMLIEEIEEEYYQEIEHLKSIGGPTGMRNSVGSATGLSRNTVRLEVLVKLKMILAGEDANASRR